MQEVTGTLVRSVEVITGEIIVIRENAKRVFYDAVVEIGKRLTEAKELVPQGEWTSYLTDVLQYKPSTAQNYMRIAREFGSDQVGFDGKSTTELFGDMSYSQLLPLLGLADEERRELVQETEVAEMSTREIDKLVKDFKEARDLATQLEQEKKALQDKQEKLEKKQEETMEATQRLRAAEVASGEKAKVLEGRVTALMQELEDVKSGTVIADTQAVQEAREQAQAKMQLEIAEREQRIAKMQEALQSAKNPTAVLVDLQFQAFCEQSAKLYDALAALKRDDSQTSARFAMAIVDRMGEEMNLFTEFLV